MTKKQVYYTRVKDFLNSKRGRKELGAFYQELGTNPRPYTLDVAETIHYIESNMKSAYKYVTLHQLYAVIEHFNISP